MLKRSITYEDFDGKTVTEEFYFNISQPELVEMEVEHKDGFAEWLQNAIKAEDNKTLMEQFKNIILTAYGEKSEDGRRFMKTAEIREGFSQTAAFIALYTELFTSDKAASEFIVAIMPKEIVKASEGALQGAPPAPPTPTS